MQIKPLRNKVFCEILPDEEISEGGIIIVTRLKQIPRKARIIAMGKPPLNKKGKELKWNLNIGDHLHFKKNFGFKYSVRGDDGKWKHYIFLRNEEITARETKEEE